MSDPTVRHDTQAFLGFMERAAYPPVEEQTPEDARAGLVASLGQAAADVEVIETSRDVQIPTPEGGLAGRLIDVRADREGAGPLVVWFHGGGGVTGGLETHASQATRALDLPVLLVAYRLAPEARSPAADDDARAATDGLRASNTFGADTVASHPHRFGLLAALPTDDPEAALAEVDRAQDELHADGFAVTFNYKGVLLSDPSLDPVWTELDRRRATVFAHPDAYAEGSQGRPAALLEVAFETTRVVTDMLYKAVFRRFPNIRFVIAHCGAALPALSGRLTLLGLESWVPNPARLSPSAMTSHLRSLYLDTAATCPTTLAAALEMTSAERLVYGSDCGVACTSDATMDRNLGALLAYQGLTAEQKLAIGRRALALFPTVAARLADVRPLIQPTSDS